MKGGGEEGEEGEEGRRGWGLEGEGRVKDIKCKEKEEEEEEEERRKYRVLWTFYDTLIISIDEFALFYNGTRD